MHMFVPAFVDELFEKVYVKCSALLNKVIRMDLGENPEYSKKSTLDIYVCAGVNESYIQSTVNELSAGRLILGKISDFEHIQSADTVLNRIKQKDPKEILAEARKANDKIIDKAVQKGAFEDPFTVALDSHNVYRHTKIKREKDRKKKCDDIQKVVGTKPKGSCTKAHQYMTIKAIDTDYRYTLDIEPVLPLKNRVKIAEQLINSAEKRTQGRIDCILGDGDFDSVAMINMFYTKKKHFVVRADQDSKVKKVIEKCKGLWCYIEYGYRKGKGKHTATYNLVVIDVKALKKYKIELPLADKRKVKYIVFGTDLAPKPNESDLDFCIALAKLHKKRWGIETGYRDKIEFRGKTHALSYSVRLFFFLLSVIMYNLWVQININYKESPGRVKMFPDGIPKSFIGFLFVLAVLLILNESTEPI